jgi:hypothetical protein
MNQERDERKRKRVLPTWNSEMRSKGKVRERTPFLCCSRQVI